MKDAPKSSARKLYEEGLALFEKDQQAGAALIAKAAELGDPEAQDWIDDWTFDDDANTQGAS